MDFNRQLKGRLPIQQFTRVYFLFCNGSKFNPLHSALLLLLMHYNTMHDAMQPAWQNNSSPNKADRINSGSVTKATQKHRL